MNITYAILLIQIPAYLYLGYQIFKNYRERMRREKAKETADGIDPIIYDSSGLSWMWDGEVNTRFPGRIVFGRYDHHCEMINIYMGSAFYSDDTEAEVMTRIEQTVIHELVHWAEGHGSADSDDVGANHAERYNEVIDPLVKPRWENES